MARHRKTRLRKLRFAEAGVLLFLFALGALSVWKLRGPETSVPEKDDPRYRMSLVDVWGRRLSPAQGPLKYVLNAETFVKPAPNQHLPWLNTDGRGNRVTTGQPTDRPVAVLLGGSTAFGYGANSDDETISSRLQRLTPRWKWVNMAAPGFASGEELAQMVFNGDALEPAIYVSLNGFNDYWSGTVIRDGLAFGRNQNFLLETSDRLAAGMNETGVGREMALPFNESMETYQQRLSTYQRNVRRMRDFASARGARFVLVLQPSSESCRTLVKKRRGCPAYANQFVPAVMAYCRANGIACLNLNDRAYAFPDGTFDGWVHLTPQGNEPVARAIAASILSVQSYDTRHTGR